MRTLLRPSLLLSDQALHELGALLLVGLDAFVEQHFTNLAQGSLFLFGNPLEVTFQVRIEPEG